MSRLERRYRANQVAHKRLMSLPPDMRDQPVGRFRKWNMTCSCHCCGGAKLWAKRNYMDDLRTYRRNG